MLVKVHRIVCPIVCILNVWKLYYPIYIYIYQSECNHSVSV